MPDYFNGFKQFRKVMPDLSIGVMDNMIAAHARSHGATLVSNNTRHFKKVPELLIANWV